MRGRFKNLPGNSLEKYISAGVLLYFFNLDLRENYKK